MPRPSAIRPIIASGPVLSVPQVQPPEPVSADEVPVLAVALQAILPGYNAIPKQAIKLPTNPLKGLVQALSPDHALPDGAVASLARPLQPDDACIGKHIETAIAALHTLDDGLSVL